MNMTDILLKITDLHASVGDKEILKGINLEIRRGEIHAVMGPNGAGKSTLSSVLTGKPNYEVTDTSVDAGLVHCSHGRGLCRSRLGIRAQQIGHGLVHGHIHT